MNIEDRLYIDTCPGIYYFKNLLNNKYYIGQAVNIRKRLIHHLSNFINNRYNAPLYKAFQKYGIENFEFGILKRIEEADLTLKNILDFWEKYYITLYNSYGATGYNQTKGGDAGVLGLKMTDEQKQRISLNAKKQANDGRNKVFCYDIEKKIIIQCPSLPALYKYLNLNITLGTSSLRNILIAGRYLISRTLATLDKKISIYNERSSNIYNSNVNNNKSRDITGKYPKKITEEALQDIINGMTQKDWIEKYNLCKATYSQYKRKLIASGKMKYTRIYNKKVSKEDFIEYMSNHSVKEAAEHFKVNIHRIYKYKKLYNLI